MTVVSLSDVRGQHNALRHNVADLVRLIGDMAEAEADLAFRCSSPIPDRDVARAANRFVLRRLKGLIRRELKAPTFRRVRGELVEHAVAVFTHELGARADERRWRA